jgi:ADP-ribosylglycohydrolase
MLGAIAGDVIGSVHEASATKSKRFLLFTPDCCFTDDTVLTVAVADCLLSGRPYVDAFHKYYHLYPDAGYGGNFIRWASLRQKKPYQSWGNGSAMRVSPIAYAFNSLEEVLAEAKRSAEVTHDHPEGIRGAQATAAAIFMARKERDKQSLKQFIERVFGYRLDFRLRDIRPHYLFDVSCQGSVPESLVAFLESTDYEDAVRNAISLGGDADTMASVAGAVAEAFYGGVPEEIAHQAMELLDDRLRRITAEFRLKFSC